jgi:probable HAF family extracellular repeat protein
MTLLVSLATTVRLAAQDDAHTQAGSHHHYKLIDLGTFGGPISGVNVEPTEKFINSAGTIVGGADTSFPTPEPSCYNPVLNPDCFIFHAFVWKGGGLKDLGTLRGGTFSWAEGINNRGQVAGVSENGENDPVTGNPEFHAVLWQNGQIVDLGTLGGNSSFAGSINDQGQVMGVSLNAVADPFSIVGLCSGTALTQTRGFLWEHGKMHDLGTLGGPDTFPIFSNEHGQVAGMSDTSYSLDSLNFCTNPPTPVPSMDPFLWENGKMKDLGNFGGTNPFGLFSGFVSGLNNRGQVAGTVTSAGDQNSRAFLWDGERLSDLGTLGGSFAVSYGLNEKAEVVGLSALSGDNVFHGFLWRTGVMTDLGPVDGDACSTGENINSRDQVVGASQAPDGMGGCVQPFTHAVLWEDGGAGVDLNSLIPPNSPLQLTDAAFISDRGEIVGGGNPLGCTNNDSCNHVFLLIPCDENHPGIEGCDYSLADGATATEVRPKTAASAGKLTPAEMKTRFRSMMANRQRKWGNLPRP